MSNEVMKGKGFYILYDDDPCDGIAMFESDDGAETTICVPDASLRFRILNGDFRKEYRKAIPNGLDACIAVYNEHKGQNRSSWSSDDE